MMIFHYFHRKSLFSTFTFLIPPTADDHGTGEKRSVDKNEVQGRGPLHPVWPPPWGRNGGAPRAFGFSVTYGQKSGFINNRKNGKHKKRTKKSDINKSKKETHGNSCRGKGGAMKRRSNMTVGFQESNDFYTLFAPPVGQTHLRHTPTPSHFPPSQHPPFR